jgi:1-acyl-sn-glycerol-3-phosphate acyltransferase
MFALKAEVPIVPVGLVYTEFSNGQKTHVDIKFGTPIMPEDYALPPIAELARGKRPEYVSQLLEDRVADLTGMAKSGLVAQLRSRRRQARGNSNE